MVRWNTTTTVRDVASAPNNPPNLTNLADRSGIVTLATIGTLKVDGVCWDDGTHTFAATFIETTQDGAYSQGYSSEGKTPLNVADGPVEVSTDWAENDTASDSFASPDDGSWAAMNAGGTVAINGFGNQAVPSLSAGANATCVFNGFAVIDS